MGRLDRAGLRGAAIAAASVLALSAPGPLSAGGEGLRALCPLVLHQQRVALDERALEVELAASRLAAAQAIFELVDELWRSDAVERMTHLAARHDRDVAELDVTRHRLVLRRREAQARQLAAVCAPGAGDEGGDAAALDAAHAAYLQADCHRIGKELAIAEADLAYVSELRTSVVDLRRHGTATRQDVIRTERDVEMARERVAQHRRRVEACIRSGDAAGKAPS